MVIVTEYAVATDREDHSACCITFVSDVLLHVCIASRLYQSNIEKRSFAGFRTHATTVIICKRLVIKGLSTAGRCEKIPFLLVS